MEHDAATAASTYRQPVNKQPSKMSPGAAYITIADALEVNPAYPQRVVKAVQRLVHENASTTMVTGRIQSEDKITLDQYCLRRNISMDTLVSNIMRAVARGVRDARTWNSGLAGALSEVLTSGDSAGMDDHS